tara:strand:+ start:6983 stop:8095 length:1113 start_codon:yes stop_codon:yes gene_type:complete
MILSSDEKLSKSKLELDANTILVIDDFHSEDDYKELLRQADKTSYTSGWKSNRQIDPHGHWNKNYVQGVKSNSSNLAEVCNNIPNLQKKVWDILKEKYHLNDMILLRCYMNAHTYGVDGYIHADSRRNDEWTMITYLNEMWDPNWAGETIILEDGEIVKSVIPKRNRAVIFASKKLHAARGVSRMCYDLRKTLMFKFRATRCDDFERLSQFLINKGANKHKHSHGSLHDHLMRNFSLLKDKGYDIELCFAAGLHSIFGTNAFTKCILREDDFAELSVEFGDKAASLARLFSTISRPKTLEDPESLNELEAVVKTRDDTTITIPRYAFDELRIMEAANLFDQKSLNIKKYPNLCELSGMHNIKKDKNTEFQ